jgi:hypothetical protein
MKKTIEVCDVCELEKRLTDCDGIQLCNDCSNLYYKAKNIAAKKLDEEVRFYTIQASNIAYFVKNDLDPVKHWGTEGMKIRDKFLLELNKHNEKKS